MLIDPSAGPDPPLGMPDPPRSWLEFWVRFVCGALLGGLVATLGWLRFFLSVHHAWIAIPVITLVCAFAAARYGDNFWVSSRAGLIRWNFWNQTDDD
jgi:hypothetical protein